MEGLQARGLDSTHPVNLAEPPPPRGEDLEDESSDQLVIQCAMCRRTFPSGIYIDHQSFDDLSGKVHECPFCGFTTAYSNVDYRSTGWGRSPKPH